ncbi:MAG: ABC transporter ATP-binding protein [Clostridiales bacterium]|jgi:oligopeptide transport system ATP-binding protein|nr:ABC transporter ATP-binding protein [Clostridiales bacterium]
MERETVLQVNDLHLHFKTYSGVVQALRGVSFELKKGETLAIVGESGSGKSVTTKAITRLLSQNAMILRGSAMFKGTDLLSLPEPEISKIRGNQISLVFQDPLSALDPVMKIGRQITETLIINKKMPYKAAKEKALELMDSVGIPNPAKRFNEYPFQFSGGMRQRIVIAIALSCDPEILICDEPTTALDVTIQSQILDLIKAMQKKKDLSVIYITHDLGVVANVADRVCVMYAGKILEVGTVMDIFYNPRHPYTWSLLSSMPSLESKSEDKLMVIPGAPPNMLHPPSGDAFASRNRYAMKIDFEREPPLFKVSDTHYAATWLMHPNAPKFELPEELRARFADRMGGVVPPKGGAL